MQNSCVFFGVVSNFYILGGDYRYSFQGQEKDDEVKDIKGGSINYKYRMHDPRVGRFFAIDPLARKYPHYTPYSFSGNKVIAFVELEGLEEIEPVVPQYGPVLENEAPEILLPEVFDGYQKMLDDWKKNGLYPAPEELDNEQLEAPDFDEWLKIFDIDMNSPEWNTNPAEMQRQYNFAIDMYNSVIDLVNARRMAENARRINSEFGVTPLLPLLEKKLKLIETPDLDFELDIPDEVPPGDPIPIESIPPPSEELLAISEEKNTNNTKE